MIKNNRISDWLISNIIVINIFFDIFSFWTPNRGWLGFSRAIILILIYSAFFISKGIPRNRGSIGVFLFFIYLISILPFSTDIYESSRVSFQVLLALLCYPIGYKLINDYSDLARLNKNIVFGVSLLMINFAISYTLEIGDYSYSNTSSNLYLGNYADSMNIFVYSLFVMPLASFYVKKKRKWIIIILSIFLILIIAVSTKRIALAGTITGLLILLFFVRKYSSRIINWISLFTILMIATSPLYLNMLTDRWETRAQQGRLDKNSIFTEARYLETFFVWDEIFSFENVEISLFGLEAFNSPGFYGEGGFGRRMLHVDYNQILFTTGILGLFLYLLMYHKIYQNFNNLSKRLKVNSLYFKVLKGLFYMLFFGSLVTSLGGQMYGISFRSLIFLYLGGLTNYLNKYYSYNHIKKTGS